MRFVTYGPPGAEEPGVLMENQRILPLRPLLSRRGIATTDVNTLLALWPAIVPLIRTALTTDDGISSEGLRLGPPVPRPGKVIAIGFNYAHHGDGALSGALTVGGDPIIFLKPPSCVTGPNDPIVKPPETNQLDYELELGVVIGRAGRRIGRADAWSHVAGYVLANDFTARDIAIGAGAQHPLLFQIARGKGFPTFCPTGPWLLTRDEIDPGEPLHLSLSVNGSLRQVASTEDMLVDVPGLIEWVSSSMDLFPGDLILTGSPPGCGFQLDPPSYLNGGDRIQASITGLGHMDVLVQDELLAEAKATTTGYLGQSTPPWRT